MSSIRIYCNHTDPLWQNGNLICPEQATDIWKIRISDSISIPENILSNEELLKASRFLHARDRASFTCRRTALRILLSRYTGIPLSEIGFILGKNKKPELRSESNKIRFNVSHSGDLVLIAISDTDVGVDIEQCVPTFNYSEVLKHSFSKQEIDYIEHATDSRELFFKLWTRKEALTKASSKGLDDDLRNIPCLDGWHGMEKEIIGLDGTWQLNSFSIDHGYTGSIACLAGQKLNYLNFEF